MLAPESSRQMDSRVQVRPAGKTRLRRVLRVALRVYLILCGVLVPLVVGLIVFRSIFCPPPAAQLPPYGEGQLFQAYGNYMINEHPERGKLFASVASGLDCFRRSGRTVDRKLLFKYLGAPQFFRDGPEAGEQAFAYLYDSRGEKDGAVLVIISGGAVSGIAFLDMSNVEWNLKPYPLSATPQDPESK